MSPATEAPFGGWRSPDIRWKPTQESLAETLDGGQSFRWRRGNGFFEGRWGAHVARLRATPAGIEYAVPRGTRGAATKRALRHYLADDIDFATLTDNLPWRSDAALATAMRAFPHLRILRQPLPEALFCFLCSPTKRIPQIRELCETIALRHGTPLADGSKSLPDWNTLGALGEAPLRAAGLGYRAGHIHKTAVFLAENPDWLNTVADAPTDAARDQLTRLPGVGGKIADCVLLFGAGRLEAFPVDTWVQRTLRKTYGLEGWTVPQLRQFARAHFGDAAGYAQQYLFAAARAGLIAC